LPGFIIGETKQSSAPAGFKLNNVADEYYTNFFWDVSNIFDDFVKNERPNNSLLALRDCKLPTFTVEEEKVLGSSVEYKFAKKVNWDDISMTWYDNFGLLNIMKKWMNSVFTLKYGMALASAYKKQTKILVYTPSNSSRQTYTLNQSWPKSIKFGDLSYTSSDIKIIETTISYDYALYAEN
jgi:hypothetical protein